MKEIIISLIVSDTKVIEEITNNSEADLAFQTEFVEFFN